MLQFLLQINQECTSKDCHNGTWCDNVTEENKDAASEEMTNLAAWISSTID